MKSKNKLIAITKRKNYSVTILFLLFFCTFNNLFAATPACITGTYLDIPNGTTTTSLGFSVFDGGTYPIVYIEGTFTADNSDIVFQNNCTVYMAPGARIIVQQGWGVDVINNSIVTKCTDMWDKIELEPGANVYTSLNSNISGGNYGVYCDANTTANTTYIDISATTFNADMTGIYVEPSGGGFNNISIQEIIGTTFVTTSPLGPQYAGGPTIGTIGYVGIELNDMVGNVGDDLQDPNYFGELNIGIITRRSIVSVTNSSFATMFQDVAYGSNVYDASAIYAFGGSRGYSLNFTPYLGSLPGMHTVMDSRFGAYTVQINATINKVDIFNVNTGVYSTLCNQNMTTEVNNCTMLIKDYGIDWFNNAGSSQMLAFQNDIKSIGMSHATMGISLREVSSVAANYLIKENTLDIQFGQAAIYASAAFNPIIDFNIITRFPPQNAYGIIVKGCDKDIIKCNTVSGSGSATGGTTVGISSGICANGYVHCNTVDASQIGIEFDGVCGNTDFKGNSMNNHDEGLHLEKSSLIGIQSDCGNTWDGTYSSGYGAVNLNTFALVPLNRFYVTSTGYPLQPVDDCPNAPGTWFNPSTNVPWADCYSLVEPSDCSEMRPGPDDQTDKLDTIITTDSTLTDYFPEETKQMAKKYLYDKLDDNDSIIQADTLFADFYSSLQNTSYAYLKNVKNILDTKDADFLVQQTYNDSIIDTLAILIKQNESLINNGDTDTTLITENAGYRQELNDAVTTVKNLEADNAAATQSLIADAIIENALITGSESVLSFDKTVNAIYLSTLAQGINSFTSQQQSDLLFIAQQCPYAGGPAVYRARNMYSIINDTIVYDDSSTCAIQGFLRKAQNHPNGSSSSLSVAGIFPNPASESATINYLLNTESSSCLLEITDITGRTLTSYSLPCNKNQFSFSTFALSNGLYLYKVISNGGIVAEGKLAISK